MLEFASLVILTAVLVSVIVFAVRGGRRYRPANPEAGTLYVTGVSPRPDIPGEQYVTITGNLTGPSVPGKVVYGRFVWDTNSWPETGDLLTVVYPAGKPDSWQITRPGAGPDVP
ncbi:hypothetical protein [Nocardia barduliensis]|uniref:hypothetical protein n=1 Tax=Nocardia barduliensis TaxID=2736643 RepID=UPI001574BFCD|nr:hypothetical protein [Nocardia barduliensis]